MGRVYIGATAGQAAVTPVYQLRLQEQFSRVCAHGADARVRIPTSTGRTQGVRNTGEHTGPTCLPRGLRVTQAASRQKGSSWIPSPRTSPSQTVGWPSAGHKRREGEKREEHSRIKVMTDAETRQRTAVCGPRLAPGGEKTNGVWKDARGGGGPVGWTRATLWCPSALGPQRAKRQDATHSEMGQKRERKGRTLRNAGAGTGTRSGASCSLC